MFVKNYKDILIIFIFYFEEDKINKHTFWNFNCHNEQVKIIIDFKFNLEISCWNYGRN